MNWTGARLIVFDLDGTLVDSLDDLTLAMNTALARLVPGTPPLPVESVRSFVGNGARLLVTRSLAAAGLVVPVDEALAVYVDAYRECLLATTSLYPGVADTLARLGDRRLAVLTNKPGDMSRTILSGLGIAERFFRIVGAGDAAAHKPDPAALLRLMGECDARQSETLVVGDSATDVRTARAAGVGAVGVTYGFAPEGFATDPPDALLDSFAALADLLVPPPNAAVVR